jgi:hypothetical protein
MMRALVNISMLFGLIAVLSGCAADKTRYPSLALRPFETGALPVMAAPDAPTPIRPATSPATLAALRDRAATAHAGFLQREANIAKIAPAAAGQSVESNARAAALVAMADLTSQRGATSAVLAELDLLAADAATSLSPDPALVATQTDVAALIARQDAGIAQLWDIIGS